MDRELQIELLDGASARLEAVAKFWANDPAVQDYARESYARRKAQMTPPPEAPAATNRPKRRRTG
jgi:hypothetical protein